MAEYNGSDTVQRIFIYGNYIDEVVFIYNFYSYSYYFYVHDHLYSPAALVDSTGTVVERYEYDAYGNPTIWNADFTTERDSSNYGNPYLFTGRRVDILDSSSLKIQYNRNRYYDYYSGRWLTHDPLGITPNPQKPNKFDVVTQYNDGLSLYEYVGSNPVHYIDPTGTEIKWSWSCPVSGFTKKLCKCLMLIPYFGTCGARSIEVGWCNTCALKCSLFCETDVPKSDVKKCKKKCSQYHAVCTTIGMAKKCIFAYTITSADWPWEK